MGVLVYVLSAMLSAQMPLSAVQNETAVQVVYLRFVLPDGSLARIGVRSGEKATVGFGGRLFRLTVAPTKDDRVRLELAEVAGDTDIGPLVTELLQKGTESQLADTDIPFKMEWTETRTGLAESAQPQGPCSTCCVECNGFYACARASSKPPAVDAAARYYCSCDPVVAASLSPNR